MSLTTLLQEAVEPMSEVARMPLDLLVERLGPARVIRSARRLMGRANAVAFELD